MSNVWTTAIAVARATCSSTRRIHYTTTPSQALNGFAPRACGPATRNCFHRFQPGLSPISSLQVLRQSFSTTANLLRKDVSQRHVSRSASGVAYPESKLQPAQTVASYTEGVIPDQAEGGLTWRDYDPVGGMPIPGGDRSQAEINAIFNGEDVSADTGNYILNVMYWRRNSGALIDAGVGFPQDSGVSQSQALLGLEYIRSLEPELDEEAAGQRYVEEETEKLRQQMRERAVKLGIYRPEEQEDNIPEEEQQGTEYGRERSSQSALLKLREANEQLYEEEQTLKKIQEMQAASNALHAARGPLELGGGVQPSVLENAHLAHVGPGSVTIGRPQSEAWLQPVERKPWVKYYEEQAQIIVGNQIPQLSMVRRLGPSLLLLLMTLSGCYYLASHYTPPPKAARMFPDTPPALATVATLSGVLFVSFIASRLPPLWRTYNKYFCLTPGYPNAIGLLGASWRHDSLRHLFVNLATLWAFGPVLHEDIGRGGFLAAYIACGAIGGMSALTWNVARQNFASYIFGASGNVLGVASMVCILRSQGKVEVLGNEIPVSGWVLLGIGAAWFGFGAWRGVKAVDHAGHLGGMASGILMGWMVRQRSGKERASAS